MSYFPLAMEAPASVVTVQSGLPYNLRRFGHLTETHSTIDFYHRQSLKIILDPDPKPCERSKIKYGLPVPTVNTEPLYESVRERKSGYRLYTVKSFKS